MACLIFHMENGIKYVAFSFCTFSTFHMFQCELTALVCFLGTMLFFFPLQCGLHPVGGVLHIVIKPKEFLLVIHSTQLGQTWKATIVHHHYNPPTKQALVMSSNQEILLW